MKTADFDYDIPEELIAFYPLSRREESRLMVVRRDGQRIEHRRFFELPHLLKEGDLIVLNDTKVVPVRLFGRLTSGKSFEVLLTEKVTSYLWKVTVRSPKEGMTVEFEGGLEGKLIKNGKDQWLLEFGHVPADDELLLTKLDDRKEQGFGSIDRYLERFGKMPLPPYIRRQPEELDRVSYQTVYAEKDGAIAAPTAGLHFSFELLDRIRTYGVEIKPLTLHVGVGSFRPVKTDDIRDHDIHAEYREIPEETAVSVNRAKSLGRRVVAVGTTVVRALESCLTKPGELRPAEGYTDLFIYPGYRFKVVDALITNFHLPRSTLLMLVSAFAGRELILHAYEEAKKERYRFLSYGDAMLIV